MIVIFFYYSICFEGQGCYTASLSPFHPESHRLLQRTPRRAVRYYLSRDWPSTAGLIPLRYKASGVSPKRNALLCFSRKAPFIHAIHMQFLRNEFHVGDHLFVLLHGIELHIHMEHVVPRFAGDR